MTDSESRSIHSGAWEAMKHIFIPAFITLLVIAGILVGVGML